MASLKTIKREQGNFTQNEQRRGRGEDVGIMAAPRRLASSTNLAFGSRISVIVPTLGSTYFVISKTPPPDRMFLLIIPIPTTIIVSYLKTLLLDYRFLVMIVKNCMIKAEKDVFHNRVHFFPKGETSK